MSDKRASVEEIIIGAVKQLLTGRVNDILREAEYSIPLIELGNYGGGYSVCPVVCLASCERTEKERIIRVDAYTLTITFTLFETPETEQHLYAYSGAVSRAFYNNPSLSGAVDRAIVTGKKYIQPKKPNCGGEWELVISLRVTVEGIHYAG